MPCADRYAQLRASAKVRERLLLPLPRHFSELELQAHWFAGDFGRKFLSTSGARVEVVQFGTWNRAAGPDFSDAAVRTDDAAIVRGSIEFDLSEQNWEVHGHSTNPAFDDTVLHVFVEKSARTFFTRTSSHRNVAQVRVDPTTLSSSLTMNLPLARPGRCQAPLRDLPEEKVTGILEAAAQFRLQRKAQGLQRLAELHGLEEALYQELAAALGYKQNKLPFTLLAQRLPLKMLRAAPNEALLFGVAGFLEGGDLGQFDEQTRPYLRALWDQWWARRAELERLVLPRDAWRLSGSRPLNHPQRRLAALAGLVRNWPQLLYSLGTNDSAALHDFLRGLTHPYWDFHYTLRSAASAAPMALIGETRVTEIFANVILPLREWREKNAWSDFAKLSARLTNRRLETGAARLFGNDPRRRQFLRTVAQQQGLLQIYEDFCLQDNSDCAQCPFPEQMEKWT